MLVEGESLLNDGTAMVLYLIMLDYIETGVTSPDILGAVLAGPSTRKSVALRLLKCPGFTFPKP